MGSSGTHVLNPVKRTAAGLYIILQMKKYLLSYHKLFLFSLELVWKNCEKRSVEWGGIRAGDGMSGSLGRIYTVKKRIKEEWKSGTIYMLIYGHWWPSNRLNQTGFSYYEIKCTCSSKNKKKRNVSRLLYWFKTLQAIQHMEQLSVFAHFLTLRKPFSLYKIGMAKEAKYLHQTFSQ